MRSGNLRKEPLRKGEKSGKSSGKVETSPVGLLVEVGTEELPPGFQRNLLDAEDEVIGRLTRAGVRLTSPRLFVTVRRVALVCERAEPDLDLLEAEVVGPPYRAAFDEEGKPTAAAIGFARKIGREVADLYRVRREDRDYVASRQRWQGKMESLLEEALPGWVASLAEYAEKRMRWGTTGVEFVRPVRWICALLGDRVLKFEFAGVRSGALTRGHRWALLSPVRLRLAGDYLAAMEKGFVNLTLARDGMLVQLAERRFGGGGLWSHHPALPMMLEHPSLGIGRVPERFLSLPDRLIETVLEEQMKCMMERDGSGKVTGRFAFTIDRPPGFYDEETVRRGYARLAEARLMDASYFYDRDIRTPFDEWRERLNGILFLENVGSLSDKVQWMEELLEATEGRLPLEVNREVCRWVVRLCRNDQPTRMVREFTSLEGEVGRLYLEDRRVRSEVPEVLRERVALGVRDSYLPRGADDALPETTEGGFVSALDKIVTLALYFQTGERPTGTRDPLGFRRVALGLLRVLDRLAFDVALEEAVRAFARRRGIPERAIGDLGAFLQDRWEGWVREAYAVDFDICQAVRDRVFESPRRATHHALWLQNRVSRWQGGEDTCFGEVVRIVTRVHNLAREAPQLEAPSPLAMLEPEEREMFHRIYIPLKAMVPEGRADSGWRDRLCDWLTVERIAVMDRFFDKVLVMHEDEGVRRNRLHLIGGIDAVLSELGALWKLERG
jgi:glycyl-tRNA synthetase beta chain